MYTGRLVQCFLYLGALQFLASFSSRLFWRCLLDRKSKDMHLRLADELLCLDMPHSKDAASIRLNELERQCGLLETLIQGELRVTLAAVCTLPAALYVALSSSWKLTLVLMGAVLFIVLLTRAVMYGIRRSMKHQQNAMMSAGLNMEAAFQRMPSIIAHGWQALEIHHYAAALSEASSKSSFAVCAFNIRGNS